MKHIELNFTNVEQYPMFKQYHTWLRFYEELESCSKELKKSMESDHLISKKSENLDLITLRNYEILLLNFNFFLGLLNLFKFDETKIIDKLLIKIYFINLYLYIKEQFELLRKKFDNFFYLNYDEENRYLDSLMQLLKNNNGMNLFPSKIGFLFLRQIRYYIYKINKFIFRKDRIYKLCYYNAKFNFICTQAVNFLSRKDGSLFEQSMDSDRWQLIKKNSQIELIESFEKGEIKKKFVHFFTNFMNALYYAIDFPNFTVNYSNLIKMCYYSILFAFSGETSKNERKKNITQQNLQITKLIFESYESKIINLFYTISRVKTKHNIKFHIIEFGDLIILKRDHNISYSKSFNYRLISNTKQNISICEKIIQIKTNFYKTLKNYLYIRNFTNKYSQIHIYNIIFFIHGGGFLAQSSESSVGFLSEIAKDVSCLIFAFDYRLAPENKIEDMVNECNKAYKILVNNLLKFFDFKINKIIICGDSAGGFFSLNLVNHLIKSNMKPPDGLILIYPCTRIYLHDMLPSHLLSLSDSMIDSPFLSQLMNITLNIDSYYSGELKFTDIYNFLLTDSYIVRKFPKTFILVGSNDPIRDESYRLMDFLIQNQVHVELKEYLYFPHGFMNLTSLVDKYYFKGVEDLKNHVSRIFND